MIKESFEILIPHDSYSNLKILHNFNQNHHI